MCFKDNKKARETLDKIFVPLALRIQKVYLGTQTGHTSLNKTLAKIRGRYVWDNMARDVDKVLKVYIQCWRQSRGATKRFP